MKPQPLKAFTLSHWGSCNGLVVAHLRHTQGGGRKKLLFDSLEQAQAFLKKAGIKDLSE